MKRKPSKKNAARANRKARKQFMMAMKSTKRNPGVILRTRASGNWCT